MLVKHSGLLYIYLNFYYMHIINMYIDTHTPKYIQNIFAKSMCIHFVLSLSFSCREQSALGALCLPVGVSRRPPRPSSSVCPLCSPGGLGLGLSSQDGGRGPPACLGLEVSLQFRIDNASLCDLFPLAFVVPFGGAV